MLLTYDDLTIRTALPEDCKTLARWWNDGAVMAHAGFPNGLGTTSEEIAVQLDRRDCCRMILEKHSVPIGEMSYRDIGDRTAEIGIKICDFSQQERGYGRIFLSLLLDWLFSTDYETVKLDTNLKNTRAQHVYELLGFQKVRVNMDAWTDQMGCLQSSVDYVLRRENFVNYAAEGEIIMNLCDRREIQALLSRHGFHFSKSMGQNFLIADWVPRDIAAASGADSACGVLEIGPGIGCLTRALCAQAGRVVSVELDQKLLPVLAETMAGCENFVLLQGDILQQDIPALVEEYFAGLTPMVCANLPYNITAPVLRAFVEARCFSSLTVMIQREVAQRLAAKPGTAAYGAFSVYMQYYSQPEVLFEVPPSCFLPAPQVTSAVVRCRMRAAPPVSPVCGEAFFFQTVRAAFALRRKTLVNSLASVFGQKMGKADLASAVTSCGLPPTVRGETLGLEEMAALADEIYRRMEGDTA